MKTPPLFIYKGGETKRVAREDEHEAIVLVPDIVGIVIVRVEPQVIVIVFHVEQVEIAVRVGNV